MPRQAGNACHGLKKYGGTWEFRDGGEGIVLRKDRNVERRGESSKMVVE